MTQLNNFINVILPIPLQKLFTYQITTAEASFLKVGVRVAVPFGKSKIYTALVYQIHQSPPEAYQAKQIHQILDKHPIISEIQLQNWSWIANYYMCSMGEVMRAAIPSALLLESETLVCMNENFNDRKILNDDEFLIFEALETKPILNLLEISKIVDRKIIIPIIKNLLDKDAVYLREEIFEQYKPKIVTYIRLHSKYKNKEELHLLIDSLNRAKKQREVLLTYFTMVSSGKAQVKVKDLLNNSRVSKSVITALVDKQILEYFNLQTDRVSFDEKTGALKELSTEQNEAFLELKKSFQTKEVVLFHGVTSSGKTEIYAHLIQEILESGKQVLYLLPEIALTTQIITRLQNFFGDKISVYHSNYSINERVEVWNNLLHKKNKAQIILGARSSVLLPYNNLGLIIVDEEHETSYKQFDPSPRYNARDTAIVLAKQHGAKIILGSATPSIESFNNAKNNKYGYVTLDKRFNNVLLPEVELVDIKEKYRKKRMQGHFSDRLIELIQNALDEKEQIILFQNRRGYSPIVECTSCGIAPQCPNCDVSLTFHKYRNELRCHYCGYHKTMPKTCPACENPSLDTKGFGTEQIEIELQELFPAYKIARMDFDTTRGKYGYQKIISSFQDHEIDILVGTQMLTKGLDFKNVSLVGVLNADNMLNFPDFRAHERSYQLLVQVSGRAGRAKKRGKVAIQTFNPYHQILQQVSANNYDHMFKDQMNERFQFGYPPVLRLIKLTLKHKDSQKVSSAADWLGKSLRNSFQDNVLGPSSPIISRIRNQYIKTILIKLPKNRIIKDSKNNIQKIINSFQSIGNFRAVRINIDVDNY